MTTAAPHPTGPPHPQPAATPDREGNGSACARAPVHVVIGAGPLARAVAAAASGRGHPVRLVTPGGAPGGLPPGVEAVAADARRPETMAAALADAGVVHHCADPPFDRWPRDLPPLMIGVIQAAAQAGAAVVYADDPSVYGPVDGPMTEDLPARPAGARARVRAALAGLLLSAHRDGAVSAAIARAPDLFGPGVVRSALGRPMIEAAMRGLPVPVIGDADQPHSLCFVRDHAAAMVALAERPDLHGRVWHVPCAPPTSLRAALELAGGRPVRLRRASRGLLLAFGLAKPRLRAIREITYQFERPFVVDSAALSRAAGLAATPLDRALDETRAAFGLGVRRASARVAPHVGALR